MCAVSWTDSNSKLPLFGRALKSEVKLDPLELLGTTYKVTGTLNKGEKKIIDLKSPDTSVNVPPLTGQQHAGRLAPGQRLPQRGEAGHR